MLIILSNLHNWLKTLRAPTIGVDDDDGDYLIKKIFYDIKRSVPL